jgi:hypothetical protein
MSMHKKPILGGMDFKKLGGVRGHLLPLILQLVIMKSKEDNHAD